MDVGVLKFCHLGFGYVICTNRVVAVFPPKAEPSKRMMRFAKTNDTMLDMTRGRETKSYILLEDGTLVGVAFNPQTILRRLNEDPGAKMEKSIKSRKYPEEVIDDDIEDESDEDEIEESTPFEDEDLK